MNKIAILLTVFNRKLKTIECLKKLNKSIEILNENCRVEIFLTDDGSTDGTYEAIKSQFPEIHILQGSGNLFWNQGMRLAWNEASQKDDFDFYIWMNNDTYIFEDAISQLFECYQQQLHTTVKETIVVGSCCESIATNEFSYGVRNDEKKVVPNGTIQNGNMMNGNFVLIPKNIFHKIGNLSSNYTHAMGDYDYGLRALENGFQIITTKKYVAVCETNKGIPDWKNPKVSFKKRWKSLHSPTGLNIKEYKLFKKRFWKEEYYLSILKVYLRCFFPSIFNKTKE